MIKKIALLITAILLLVGCSDEKEKNLEALKIGVMPSYDSTPILWAQEEGIFEEMGLEVEIVVYSNGNDRDTQIQTGAVDAVVSDIMGLISLIEANIQVKAISSTDTVFSVVSKKDSLSKDSISLGMAEVSVTQYAVDKGIKEKSIDKKYIDAIPQRLEMVAHDLIDGAILPEPMASMSILKGMESTPIEINSPNVLVFSQSAIDNKSDSIKTFYKAYDKGIETLNSNPDKVKDILIKALNLDANIKEVLALPTFKTSQSVPNETYTSVVEWMKTTLNRNSSVEFNDAIKTIENLK